MVTKGLIPEPKPDQHAKLKRAILALDIPPELKDRAIEAVDRNNDEWGQRVDRPRRQISPEGRMMHAPVRAGLCHHCLKLFTPDDQAPSSLPTSYLIYVVDASST
jgi:hypothetical protein